MARPDAKGPVPWRVTSEFFDEATALAPAAQSEPGAAREASLSPATERLPQTPAMAYPAADVSVTSSGSFVPPADDAGDAALRARGRLADWPWNVFALMVVGMFCTLGAGFTAPTDAGRAGWIDFMLASYFLNPTIGSWAASPYGWAGILPIAGTVAFLVGFGAMSQAKDRLAVASMLVGLLIASITLGAGVLALVSWPGFPVTVTVWWIGIASATAAAWLLREWRRQPASPDET